MTESILSLQDSRCLKVRTVLLCSELIADISEQTLLPATLTVGTALNCLRAKDGSSGVGLMAFHGEYVGCRTAVEMTPSSRAQMSEFVLAQREE
jgi:hypothetical protein